ncbi:MAG: 2-oxo acid dehydrogenase subunit E2 [Saprospiraceae bacterium]|nr:2-oxo acid dehydrogenase subunit E2 [Saprospiraceae bacterium]
MAKHELILPKMGESIMEATILKWWKKEGDVVNQDETVLEVATDKVDSEVPTPVKGKIVQLLFKENDVVAIGKTIAIIETEGSVVTDPGPIAQIVEKKAEVSVAKPVMASKTVDPIEPISIKTGSGRFYSPLVRSIAKEEQISQAQLDSISGTGQDGRVTKRDVIAFLSDKSQSSATIVAKTESPKVETPKPIAVDYTGSNVEIIEMDRMRKLIADHMVMSKQTSPHVTSYIEIDVTPLVSWREKVKNVFAKTYGQKLTFTPIFIEAVARAIKDFPMINISVQGTQIIRKLDINIGMAAALPSGNLIVPVIKNADRLNLAGLSYAVNDLANRARNNKLKPEEIQEGTFTITNVGTFGNIMGTPIINQPQVAILATGIIKKKPAVIETEFGDMIGIRQMMYLSLSYDHRVVDGALGGSFLKRIGDYLEQFDVNQSI